MCANKSWDKDTVDQVQICECECFLISRFSTDISTLTGQGEKAWKANVKQWNSLLDTMTNQG